jgi:hypothetical protein
MITPIKTHGIPTTNKNNEEEPKNPLTLDELGLSELGLSKGDLIVDPLSYRNCQYSEGKVKITWLFRQLIQRAEDLTTLGGGKAATLTMRRKAINRYLQLPHATLLREISNSRIKFITDDTFLKLKKLIVKTLSKEQVEEIKAELEHKKAEDFYLPNEEKLKNPLTFNELGLSEDDFIEDFLSYNNHKCGKGKVRITELFRQLIHRAEDLTTLGGGKDATLTVRRKAINKYFDLPRSSLLYNISQSILKSVSDDEFFKLKKLIVETLSKEQIIEEIIKAELGREEAEGLYPTGGDNTHSKEAGKNQNQTGNTHSVTKKQNTLSPKEGPKKRRYTNATLDCNPPLQHSNSNFASNPIPPTKKVKTSNQRNNTSSDNFNVGVVTGLQLPNLNTTHTSTSRMEPEASNRNQVAKIGQNTIYEWNSNLNPIGFNPLNEQPEMVALTDGLLGDIVEALTHYYMVCFGYLPPDERDTTFENEVNTAMKLNNGELSWIIGCALSSRDPGGLINQPDPFLPKQELEKIEVFFATHLPKEILSRFPDLFMSYC